MYADLRGCVQLVKYFIVLLIELMLSLCLVLFMAGFTAFHHASVKNIYVFCSFFKPRKIQAEQFQQFWIN